MTKIVEITQATDAVTCDDAGGAVIKFNMTNICSREIRVGANIKADKPEVESWLTIEGGPEWNLRPEKDQISVPVRIKAPETAAGKYTFRLLVYSTSEPAEDYTESETVSFQVTESAEPADKEEGNGFPLWIPLTILGVILLIGGGFLVYALMDKPETIVEQPPETSTLVALVPNVTTKSLEQAKNDLEKLGFSKIETESRFDISSPPNTVLDQSPAAGEKSNPEETTIILTLSDSTTTIPDVIDNTLRGAEQKLAKAGFKKIQTESVFEPKKPENTVLKQDPPPNTETEASETTVTLVVSNPGVKIPNNLIGANITIVGPRLTKLGLQVEDMTSRYNKNKAEATVLDVTPNANTQVAINSKVRLVISTKKTNWTRTAILPYLQKIRATSDLAKRIRGVEPETE